MRSIDFLRRYRPQIVPDDAQELYVPRSFFMDIAISLGENCPPRGQHPVGAVVVTRTAIMDIDSGGLHMYEVVTGAGANSVENDSTNHAEVNALRDAEKRVGRRSLAGSVLYTTHEPCPMCAGAVANSKLQGVVFGTLAEDARELAETKQIRWRSNEVSGIDIIKNRRESGAGQQFIIEGFEREKCLKLLAKASLIAETPRRQAAIPDPIFLSGIEFGA